MGSPGCPTGCSPGGCVGSGDHGCGSGGGCLFSPQSILVSKKVQQDIIILRRSATASLSTLAYAKL
jgi:hypothetical protein